METIYDWLLHNIGNAGNHYTILNTQRDKSNGLDVMARSSDFRVVNLFIHDTQTSDSTANDSDKLTEKGEGNSYVFSDEQQVINFLAEGKTPDLQTPNNESGIRIVITEPAGEVTFPPTYT